MGDAADAAACSAPHVEAGDFDGASNKPELFRLVSSRVEFADGRPAVYYNLRDRAVKEAWLNEVAMLVMGSKQTTTHEFVILKDIQGLKVRTSATLGRIQVHTKETVLGDFKAREEPYSFTFPEDEIPKGAKARVASHVKSTTQYLSGDETLLLERQGCFKFVKKNARSASTSSISSVTSAASADSFVSAVSELELDDKSP